MTFAPSSPIVKSQVRLPSFSATAWLSCLALMIAFTILIYLDSMSPGLTPDELASRLTAFP